MQVGDGVQLCRHGLQAKAAVEIGAKAHMVGITRHLAQGVDLRNYMPHLIYGQHVEYMFQMRSMVAWEKAYEEVNELIKRIMFIKPVK